jgi:hypothetical protein
MKLVIVGGLDSIVEATKVLKNTLGIDVCIEIVKNGLEEVDLGSVGKVSNPASKNVKEKLKFGEMHKDWIVHDWKKVIFSDETKINYLCFHGISWCFIHDKKNIPTNVVK